MERTMATAIWNGQIIAHSDDTVVVEGNHYFPESSLKREYVTFSNHRSSCHWKGQAHYFSLMVDGDVHLIARHDPRVASAARALPDGDLEDVPVERATHQRGRIVVVGAVEAQRDVGPVRREHQSIGVPLSFSWKLICECAAEE